MVITPLYSAQVRLECCIALGSSAQERHRHSGDSSVKGHEDGGLEHLCYEERLGLFNLKKRRLRGVSYKYMKEECKQEGVKFFFSSAQWQWEQSENCILPLNMRKYFFTVRVDWQLVLGVLA